MTGLISLYDKRRNHRLYDHPLSIYTIQSLFNRTLSMSGWWQGSWFWSCAYGVTTQRGLSSGIIWLEFLSIVPADPIRSLLRCPLSSGQSYSCLRSALRQLGSWSVKFVFSYNELLSPALFMRSSSSLWSRFWRGFVYLPRSGDRWSCLCCFFYFAVRQKVILQSDGSEAGDGTCSSCLLRTFSFGYAFRYTCGNKQPASNRYATLWCLLKSTFAR